MNINKQLLILALALGASLVWLGMMLLFFRRATYLHGIAPENSESKDKKKAKRSYLAMFFAVSGLALLLVSIFMPIYAIDVSGNLPTGPSAIRGSMLIGFFKTTITTETNESSFSNSDIYTKEMNGAIQLFLAFLVSAILCAIIAIRMIFRLYNQRPGRILPMTFLLLSAMLGVAGPGYFYLKWPGKIALVDFFNSGELDGIPASWGGSVGWILPVAAAGLFFFGFLSLLRYKVEVIDDSPVSLCPTCRAEVSGNEDRCRICKTPFEPDVLVCPTCKGEFPSDVRMCPECGESYNPGPDFVCPVCHMPVEANASNCENCQSHFWSPIKRPTLRPAREITDYAGRKYRTRL